MNAGNIVTIAKTDKTTPVSRGAREIAPVKLHIFIITLVTHLFHEIALV